MPNIAKILAEESDNGITESENASEEQEDDEESEEILQEKKPQKKTAKIAQTQKPRKIKKIVGVKDTKGKKPPTRKSPAKVKNEDAMIVDEEESDA